MVFIQLRTRLDWDTKSLACLTDTTLFGRPWLLGTDLVGCVLFLAAVTRSRLPDVGTGKVQHSRHEANISWASKGCPGGARFIAWRLFLGECRQDLRHFGECWVCLSYSPSSGPTLKKALCRTHPFGRAYDKYRHKVGLVWDTVQKLKFSWFKNYPDIISLLLQSDLEQPGLAIGEMVIIV